MTENQKDFIEFLDHLNDYDRKFQELILNRNQFELYSLLGKDIFNDFPNNLPEELLIDYFGRRYIELHEEIKRRELVIEDEDTKEETYHWYLSQINNNTSISKVGAILGNIHRTTRYYLNMPESKWPDFNNIRLSQEIISSYSLAEGFVVDTVRLIAEQNREKTYDDRKIYELCYGQIGEKLKNISKEFDLHFCLSDNQKHNLKKLGKTRNLIVHNASKADEKWISYFKTNVNIGEKIILSSDVVENLLDNLIDVMYEVYYKVSLKYLKKDRKYILPILIDVKTTTHDTQS